MKFFVAFAVIAALFCGGCGSVPMSPTAQGAQLVSGQQGQATEGVSAITHANPQVIYFFGGKLKTVTSPDGTVTTEAEGADMLTIEGSLSLGGVTYGESSEVSSEAHSGGGGQAATGGTQ